MSTFCARGVMFHGSRRRGGALHAWWRHAGLPVEAVLAGTTLGLSALALGGATNTTSSSQAGALQTAAISAFAPLYIGLPLGLLSATRWTLGREAALLLILTIALSDTFQYYSGRMFGRRLLAPVVSPKKTVEGAIGGFLGAVLSLTLIGHWWLPQMRFRRVWLWACCCSGWLSSAICLNRH